MNCSSSHKVDAVNALVTLSAGLQVLELRPAIEWHKGKALEFLLEALGKLHFFSLSRCVCMNLISSLHNGGISEM